MKLESGYYFKDTHVLVDKALLQFVVVAFLAPRKLFIHLLAHVDAKVHTWFEMATNSVVVHTNPSFLERLDNRSRLAC